MGGEPKAKGESDNNKSGVLAEINTPHYHRTRAASIDHPDQVMPEVKVWAAGMVSVCALGA
jgi:hypothetical protein